MTTEEFLSGMPPSYFNKGGIHTFEIVCDRKYRKGAGYRNTRDRLILVSCGNSWEEVYYRLFHYVNTIAAIPRMYLAPYRLFLLDFVVVEKLKS